MKKKRYNQLVKLLLYSIGEGSQREVFRMRYDLTTVVKIAKDSPSQNIFEYELWAEVQNVKKKARWLAKCYELSPDGMILIMEYLTPLGVNDPRLPKKIPAWMADTRIANWGVDKHGNVKCLDYGLQNLLIDNPWELVDVKFLQDYKQHQ